ncbi:MAG: DNA gyrase inhibitor YacG [Mariprofundus sp.]
MSDSTPRFQCPTCKKPVARKAEDFPFCSERCRTTDLGRWAAGDYRIAGDPAPAPDDSSHQH